MSKKPFDLLITDKEPIIFFEKSIICMKDGELVSLNKLGKRVLSPASTILMYLGAGTSITQEAAIFCALHDCFIAFSRGGGYIHSVWHSGRWSDPKMIVNQCKIHDDSVLRLQMAKELIKKRMDNEFVNEELLEKINKAKSIEQLLGYEAGWAKSIYREEAILSNINFKRDFKAEDTVNSRLNLLNNALYSFVTSIIIAIGLHPSVGYIHGKSRRGGLSFDIADIYKYELTIKPAFRMPENMQYKKIMYHFNRKLKADNFKIVKEIVEICLNISEGKIKI